MEEINIKELIRKNILIEYSLKEIENIIEKEYEIQLNTIDRAYIEKKYIKYCLDCWVDEISSSLNEYTEIESNITEKLVTLDNIEHFNEILSPFNGSKYYKLLMKHYDFIVQHNEKALIKRFKEKCLELIFDHSNTLVREIDFLEALVEFLDMFEKDERYPDMSKLQNLSCTDISNDDFFQTIMDFDVSNNDVELKRLQYAAQLLMGENHITLMKKYKEIIKAYFKPITIEKLTIDNRVVVELIGGNFRLSEWASDVNSYLSNDPDVEEVRFICSGIIYADANFENSIWHGKNIVMYAKTIIVCDTIKWDVSGKSATSVTSCEAGTANDGNGIDGECGECGESGGNVFIYAGNILQPQRLHIMSNGGDGSDGQSGGDGRDGKNGTGISYSNFVNKFPPCCKFNYETSCNNFKTIARNMSFLGTIYISWLNNEHCTIADLMKCDTGNMYIEAQTSEGHKIYISVTRNWQSFVLYKGSLGRPGGSGGTAGLGGQGGYSGEVINDFDIVVTANAGRNGKNGAAGKYGNHGQNGWDMAYTDFLFWSKEVYYGTGQNQVLELKYCNSSSSDRIYVPYRAYRNSEYTYAEISSRSVPKPASTKFVAKEDISMQAKHRVQATRKKNISQNHVFARYSQYLVKINIGSYQNLQVRMKNTEKQVLEKMMENKVQQMKEVSQVNITCVKPFYQNTRARDSTNFQIDPIELQEVHEDSMEVLLKNLQTGKSLNDSIKLENEEIKHSNFNKLFSFFKLQKNTHSAEKYQNDTVQDIEQLSIEKYRLDVLQEISTTMPPYQHTDAISQVIGEKAIKYLLKAESNSYVDLGIDDKLGNLQQYFFEDSEKQRENISKFCTKENIAEYVDAFKHSIIAFVMDEGEMKGVHPAIKKYYQEYNNFVREQEVKLKKFFQKFLLIAGFQDEMINQWMKSLQNSAMQAKLENDLTEDKGKLYKEFIELFSVRFQWDNYYKDPELFDSYVQHIQQEGPLSPSYRELLAYVFGISIYVYTTNDNNEIYLIDAHNPQCTEILYILYIDKNFTRLDLNQDYYLLDMSREKISDTYTKIIEEVESLKQKEDCYEYLNKKLFLSEKNKSDNTLVSSNEVDDERDMCDIIQFFSSPQEKHMLQVLLEKISSKFIGQCGIVHAIKKCFYCNGRHVTYHELHCLINAILNFVVEGRPGLNIFRWIIMAYPQHQWINEIILLKLENYFQKPLTMIPEWRGYLTNIKEKRTILLLSSKLDQCKENKTISTECIQEILYLLSSISEPVPGLEGLELSEWPYAIKEKYWIMKLRALTKWEDEELQKASYYLLSLENNVGMSLVNRFMDILIQKNSMSPSSNRESVSLVNRFMDILIQKSSMSPSSNSESVSLMKKDDFLQILSHFHNGEWIFSENLLTSTLLKCQIDTWMIEMRKIFATDGKDRDINKLIELMKGNGNTSEHILNDLYEIASIVKTMDKTETMNEDVITKKIEELRSNISACGRKDAKIQYVKENTTKILSLINNVIKLKRNFCLRDTQKLAILALFRNQKNTLIQVSTGEGKSLIVMVLSILKALCGQKVDIVTSSSVLAKRDAEVNSDIYQLFSISVSHNCMSDTERLEVYSNKDVIYGNLTSFQRDYLMDRFYGINILGDRTFDNVVIDEVDSMLLDNGNNMLYLSHELPDLDKLETIYVHIWQLINRPITSAEEFARTFDSRAIKRTILHDLHGSVTKENIRKLDLRMSDQQVNIIWERLIKNSIIDSDGYLLQENMSRKDIKNVLSSDFERYECYLVYLLKSIAERERHIYVPNYLKPFVALHLDAWINSAKAALFMQERTDYIVDVDRKENRPDRKAFITIIDRDTGTDQTNMEWDEALHQFLQLKHGCKLSMQSLKAVFISNVKYLKKYSNLYGLTGTLGSQRERDLLRNIHQVDFVTVPTTKIKKFHEDNPIICSDSEEWTRMIYEKTNTLIAAGRSVLIICETVKDVELLCCAFNTKQTTNVHTYTRDYESFDVVTEDSLCAGQIIIATNLAGRGTDIKITDKLDQAGGLHVCLTYLPANNRVEQQAFGRAARCGRNGSGRLIIQGSRDAYNISQTSHLKKEHDFEEIRRISDIKLYYETQITVEENAFGQFKEQFTRLKNILKKNKITKEITNILLHSCLDEWAFWLDANSKYIRDKHNYEESLDKLNKRFATLNDENWEHWIRDPSQMIKLAKYFAQNKNQEMAIKLFDRIIKEEPYFSETAHYYKAFALIKGKIDKYDKTALANLKSELRQAANLLDKHCNRALLNGSIIDTLKHRNSGITQIDAFKEQHKNISTIYQIFLQSIDDIFGHRVTLQSLEKYDINEDLAETLYNDFLKNGILKKSKISKDISEKTVQKIASEYSVIWRQLNDFLSKYHGCDVDLKQFETDIKNSITMPNKEEFWKELVKNNILINEIKFVKINMEKLQNIDPSLADSIGCIKRIAERHASKCDKQELFFNVHDAKEENSNDIMLEKKVLKTIVDNEKYKLLKQRGVFTFNKKATFNSSKVDCVSFSRFDSITRKDFTERDIPIEGVEGILTELVERKILAKQENGCYRLITDYDKIADLQLSSYCVYETFVELLLNTCFMYRIALQKLAKDFEKKVAVNLQIITKPHQSMIYSLMEERIIKPVKVSNDIENLEEKLVSMYNRSMTKKDFMDLLYRSGLISRSSEEEKLFHYIIKEIDSVLVKRSYYDLYINEKDKIRVFVDEKTIDSILSTEDSVYDGPIKTIKKIIRNYNYISKKCTIKTIAANLEKLKNTFNTLDAPDCSLMSLSTCVNANGSFNGDDYPEEELRVFALSGLDHLLTLQKRQWTWKMILKTTGIVVFGLVQVVVGNIITLHIAGALANMGSAFITEGMNDIFFAAMAFKSGYFNWNSYIQHKLFSQATTALTFGIGAWMSSGRRVTSSYASKIVAPNVSANGVRIAEMSGTELIKEVGRTVVMKEFGKRVVVNSLEGVVYGISNVAVDTIVDNYLQNLCRDFGFAILTKIDQAVEQHGMSDTLERSYRMLGHEKALAMITEISNSFFAEQASSKLINLCKTAVYAVINAFKSKCLKSKVKSSTNIMTLLKLMDSSGEIIRQITVLHKLTNLTNDILDILNRNMQTKLNDLSQIIQQQEDINIEDMNNFKQKVTDTWKSSLRQQAGLVIEEEVVKPIMNTVAQMMLNYAGKQIQKKFRNMMEHRYSNQFERCKKEYEESLRDLEDVLPESRSQAEKEYHNNLIRLLKKTNNPDLFAAIVRENIPMDMVCVSACLPVIEHLLMKRGINVQGLTIIVENEAGLSVEISSTPEEQQDTVIRINLVDGHFQMIKDNFSYDNAGNDASKNNCLYEALCHHIPELRDLEAGEFREQIVEEIKTNSEIREHLSHGWHRYNISTGLIGGRKQSRAPENVTDVYGQAADDEKSTVWQMKHRADKDLTINEPLNNESLNKQRTDAIREALQFCNNYLKLKQTQGVDGKDVSVSPSMFEATKYDTVFITTPTGDVTIGHCPVEMKATVKTLAPETRKEIELEVEINFDNPCVTTVKNGPQVSHVGYKVTGPKNSGYKKYGHILMNKSENEHFPHRRPDNIKVDPTTENTVIMQHKIPANKLFYEPGSKLVLERTDPDYDKSKIRGKSFVTIFY